jgi:ABC-type thiamin/hydroxymethylpyrimidine transport system permease subunit
MVFVFIFQYAGCFLAETFIAGTTSDFAQFKVVLLVVVFIYGGLICCGVFQSFLGLSIQRFQRPYK